MGKLLILKTMVTRQVFTFLKNFVIFLIDRLYQEWEYMIGYGRIYSERASERGDLYAKHIIENIIHDRVSKYDPYILDGNATISCGRASVGLGKAQLTGLSSLHRTNICSLAEEGNRLFINANLGAGPVTYRRQVKLRFGEFERMAVIKVSAIDIKVSVDFSVEKETGRNGFLLNFSINELNGFKLCVTGFNIIDWAVNLFLTFWTFVLGRLVRNLLENELEQYVLKRLPKYQFPVEGASCGNETQLDSKCEDAQNRKASPPESFQMRKIYRRKPKWLLSFPIDKIGMHDRQDSEEYVGFSKAANSFRFFPRANMHSAEIKNCIPASNSGGYRECSSANSCSEVFGGRTDPSFNVGTITGSLNQVADSITDIPDKLSKEINLKDCSEILEDFRLFDSAAPGKLDTVESNSRGNAGSSTSFAKSFEDEQPLFACERKGRKARPRLEDFHQMYVPYNNKVARDFKSLNENSQKSVSMDDIFARMGFSSEFKKNIKNLIVSGIQLPEKVDKCPSISLPKSESPEADKYILPPSIAETENFPCPSRSFDSKMNNKQSFEKGFFCGKKRKREAEDSDKKSLISVLRKSPEANYLNLSDTEMIQNELISCATDVSVKHLNVVPDVNDPDYQSEVEDSDSRETIHIEIISEDLETPEPKLNVQTSNRSNLILENENDLEEDIETDSTSVQSSEQDENEVNEGIINLGFSEEDELNYYSQLFSSSSFASSSHPVRCSGICSGSSHEVLEEDAENKRDTFSISGICRSLKNLESMDHSTNTLSANSILQYPKD